MKNIFKLLLVGLILFGTYSCTKEKVYNPVREKGYYILTPKADGSIKINGPSVFGVRPGSPFFYKIPAIGSGQITYSVKNLPKGLKINKTNGIISGKIFSKEKKNYKIILSARNQSSSDSKDFTIKVGDEICLTPPLGWNSWNCWKAEVSQDKVLASAKAMVSKGLINYGWTYINIDDVWQGKRGGKYNAIQPNLEKFPNIKSMCSEIHEMGLKTGIYSTPWITSYGGYIGSSSDNKNGYWNKTTKEEKRASQKIGKYKFEENDAKQWADWGFDYLKYDWNPNDIPSTIRMAKALKNFGRDIVYSLSNSCPVESAKQISALANVIRTAGDLKARWSKEGSHYSIRKEWKAHEYWLENGFEGKAGHYPDPDMLVIGAAKKAQYTDIKLTADEQYSHVSLWALWSAPLLIGCPIETIDDFSMGLLTNREVLEIQQDELGISAKSVLRSPDFEIFVKDLANGNKAIGLFNFKDQDNKISFTWNMANLKGKKIIRDVWRQKDIGQFNNRFTAIVPPHGVILLTIQ